MIFKYIKAYFITAVILMAAVLGTGQTVYQHVSSEGIYDFIDELANTEIIDLNSAIKPYSRKDIALMLQQADKERDELNSRQKEELDFYLMDYKAELNRWPDYPEKFDLFRKNRNLATSLNPPALSYGDSLFSLVLKPIWGIRYFFNNEDDPIYHRWGGAETYAYIGEHWGIYASLRDNSESERLCEPSFFTRRQGGPYKEDTVGGDYSEMRGGISYSWKWGNVSLIKDHLQWGNNYHGSNIIAGRTPSFAQIKLHLHPAKWFYFNYIHGWLVSEIVDSTRSYFYGNGNYREVFHEKYFAANMFTFVPFKKLHVSVGNSIVYSDIGVHAAYLIPFMFYKSIDHTLNGTSNKPGQNSQMYFDISSRQIRNLHLYGSMFIDELSIPRLTDPDRHNFLSYKIGGSISNLPFPNISATVEYTRTLPMTYQHHIPTTTFESNFYNLGHYLRDNSQEIYVALTFKPLRGLHLKASYLFAQHGDDFVYGEEDKPDMMPILENIIYENTTLAFRATWEFTNNSYLLLSFMSSDIRDEKSIRTPEFFAGEKSVLTAGFNIGF